MRKFIQQLGFFTAVFICIILLFELFCHISIPKISHHNIHAKSQLLIPQIDSNAVVILGDSRLEWGLKTQEMAQGKEHILNLAFPGSNGFDIIRYMINNEIYPKKILLGFTPNYWTYHNHQMDKEEYSTMNLFKTTIKYWLTQHSFLYDKTSLDLYFKGEKPYFIHHDYDEYGNVLVKERGDFQEREKHQLELYADLNKKFNRDSLNTYLNELAQLLDALKGKTSVYGIYMPVSDTIFSLEKPHYQPSEVNAIFENFLDFSSSFANNDSTIFYDGSHLSPGFAREFSKNLAAAAKQKQGGR